MTFDRDMNPATFTSAQILSVVGPNGTIPGPYTVTANPLGTDPDPLHPRTYQIGFAAQRSQRQLHRDPELEHRVGKRRRARHERERRGQSAFRDGPAGQRRPPSRSRTRR